MKYISILACLAISLPCFARYYDPQTARFLTKDPLQPYQGGDINPYRYVENNPVNYTDPNGTLDPLTTSVLIGAGVGAVAGGTSAYLSGGNWQTVVTAGSVGAAAGASSVLAGVYATGFAAAALVNGAIGGVSYLATQQATGSNFSPTNFGISVGAGAAGGIFGVAASNYAFFATPVIGSAVGVEAAAGNALISSAAVGAISSGLFGQAGNGLSSSSRGGMCQ